MACGANGGDDDEMITAINVTPLVDVVLVLLIILMVTASYIVSKSIPMDLPNAASAGDLDRSRGRALPRRGADRRGRAARARARVRGSRGRVGGARHDRGRRARLARTRGAHHGSAAAAAGLALRHQRAPGRSRAAMT